MPIRVTVGAEPVIDATPPGAIQQGEDITATRKPPVPLGPYQPKGAGYGQFRASQGPTGTWHWGIDLPAANAVPVVAPETMVVVKVWKNNATAPFVGYGPGGVLAKGKTTGVHHLLAHLDPSAWSAASVPTIGQVYDVGEQVGFTAPTGSDGVGTAAPHVHWEVRLEAIDSPATRAANTLNPLAWLQGRREVLTKQGDLGGIPWWVWLVVGIAYARRRR